ncbi:GNAT family N-acetyltransferase [Vibrio sp. S4M6]|uniref:GNAT family N-acetyltransferase n=1 Tax=Vibrio sinus TaxID=2946865 RepID=UPI00202A76AB|nr:GNAT family N-acetyltransferase [Vibrio sinus]MCL9782233.1 GNAT family N-acetyltransferase [Vibrio sinus]
MLEITLRGANLDDIPTLLEFEQRVIEAERPFDLNLKEANISYYDLNTLLSSENVALMVAEVGSQLVGCGYAEIRESKQCHVHDKHSYLGFMYVDSDFRGYGINKSLIDSLIKWSKEKHVYQFHLDVYADNQNAIRAYEKAGFKRDYINMSLSLDMVSE